MGKQFGDMIPPSMWHHPERHKPLSVEDEKEYDWLIFYEDQELKPPELFGGTETHARIVLERCGQNWTCHLYKRIASA